MLERNNFMQWLLAKNVMNDYVHKKYERTVKGEVRQGQRIPHVSRRCPSRCRRVEPRRACRRILPASAIRRAVWSDGGILEASVRLLCRYQGDNARGPDRILKENPIWVHKARIFDGQIDGSPWVKEIPKASALKKVKGSTRDYEALMPSYFFALKGLMVNMHKKALISNMLQDVARSENLKRGEKVRQAPGTKRVVQVPKSTANNIFTEVINRLIVLHPQMENYINKDEVWDIVQKMTEEGQISSKIYLPAEPLGAADEIVVPAIIDGKEVFFKVTDPEFIDLFQRITSGPPQLLTGHLGFFQFLRGRLRCSPSSRQQS